jgi:ankyrin repeat protein
MNQINRKHLAWVSLAAGFVLLTNNVLAQEPKKQPKSETDEVKALIDRLMEVDRQDIGYSASVTGSSFLPLGYRDSYAVLMFQQSEQTSEALKSLVKLGAKAMPQLLEHLSDARPTKIVLTGKGLMGGLFVFENESSFRLDSLFNRKSEESYTVMVGDLCYVAIGQIVNRNHRAIRYQPSGLIFVTSAPRSKKLTEDLRKEFANFTPVKHRELLLRDIHEGWESVRIDASRRMSYYYPKDFEAPVLQELARPTYPRWTVRSLIEEQLYPAKSAKERKALVDDFVRKHGEIAREGIRWELNEELYFQEAEERGGMQPARRKARECLIDVFNLPSKEKSTDRPNIRPLSDSAQDSFILSLRIESSPKLERAFADILAKTDNDDVAMYCLRRLFGRGYGKEIEEYSKRRTARLMMELERKRPRTNEEIQGWTKLHSAVDRGELELVNKAIKESAAFDAQGRDGGTALHLATLQAQQAIVEALLKAKANPNIKDSKGRLPVQIAADLDYTSLVRLLVANKSDVPDVFVAAIVGDAERLRVLLKENPAQVRGKNAGGLSPLHLAAREGHVEAVRILIANGADVKAVEDRYYERTPLHLAVVAAKPAAVAVLLDSGADANARDSEGDTALHLAAWSGNEELIKLLLARKANCDVKDNANLTPVELARANGQTKAVRLLDK